MNVQLPAHIRALLDPASYPDKPSDVELRQTHISYVLLAGQTVYKIKKPVDFGFLDFSTLDQRRAACEAELRLNRRLSPDVYLDVVPVANDQGRIALSGPGEIVDWAVRMVRLPEDRALETLIRAGSVPTQAGRRLGEIIGRFHLNAERSERISAIGGQQAVRDNWIENLEQTQPFLGRTLAAEDARRIQSFVAAFLEREASLFTERVAQGFIRDLHGDLRAGQIWMLEEPLPPLKALSATEQVVVAGMGGVRILDCIEFSERFRFSDTASDVAFLAMDLVSRRRAGMADELLGRYLEVTGDETLPVLLNFYCCYRAFVRGKVDSLASSERRIDARQRRRLRNRACLYFRLAVRYAALRQRPRLIAMCGISGSGKSYLARLLALRLGAVLINSDYTRKRLLGLQPTARAGKEAYAPEQSARTYATMLDRARQELERGHTVILDATYLRAELRQPVLDLARRNRVPFSLVWCKAGVATVAQHQRDRESDPWRVSDAGADVIAAQRLEMERPDELPEGALISVRGGNPRSAVRRIERRLART